MRTMPSWETPNTINGYAERATDGEWSLRRTKCPTTSPIRACSCPDWGNTGRTPPKCGYPTGTASESRNTGEDDMQRATILDYQLMRFIWVNNFYDHPLEGTCWWQGRFCYFEAVDYDSDQYRVYYLTWQERWRWRFRQRMFELFVGTHWTYDKENRRTASFGTRKPRWFWNLMFRFYYGPCARLRGIRR